MAKYGVASNRIVKIVDIVNVCMLSLMADYILYSFECIDHVYEFLSLSVSLFLFRWCVTSLNIFIENVACCHYYCDTARLIEKRSLTKFQWLNQPQIEFDLCDSILCKWIFKDCAHTKTFSVSH